MRRSLFAAVLAGAAAVVGVESWANPAAAVSVETNRSLYVTGDTVELWVVNGGKVPIALPGCGSFRLERFVGESYEPVPSERCVAEGDAKVLAPGRHVLKWTAPPSHSGDILRFSVAYGWGCEAGRALSQARCADFATVWSPNFRIGKTNEGG